MRETARKIRLKLPLIIGGASTLIASSAMAQEDPDLWSEATSAAGTAAANVTSFLIAVFAIPLAFFAYRLVRGALSKGA